MNRGNKPVMISVIIPARNEQDYLPATLAALHKQSYRNFETIVVANGCNDRTAELSQEAGAHVFELEPRGLGAARNLGGREARGQILVFLDADTLLEPEALKTITVQFRRKHSCATLTGCPDSEKLSHQIIYGMKNLIHAAHIHCGSSGVIICWKDHFIEIGGFDESLYLRENSHLMKRLLKFGRYRYLSTTRAVTSMRRYESQGTVEMIRLWIKIWCRSLFSDIRNATYEDWERERTERSLARARLDRDPQQV